MAQRRSRQSRSHGGHHDASRAAVLLRLGRIAREGLGKPANDNRARIWNRADGAMLIVAAVAVMGYALLRWIV
jgi:hypothetical protein